MRRYSSIKLYIVTAILSFSCLLAGGANDVVGVWLTDCGECKIEIYPVEDDSTYSGKIVWLKEPLIPEGQPNEGRPKVDTENPDEELCGRPMIGLELLWGFVYNPDTDRWEHGRIYNAENGKTYYAFVELKDEDHLRLKGSLDKRGWLGKSTIWTRTDNIKTDD